MIDIYGQFREDIMGPFNENLLKFVVAVFVIVLCMAVIRKLKYIVFGYFDDRRLSRTEYKNYVGKWFSEEEIKKALGESYEKMVARLSQKNKFKI